MAKLISHNDLKNALLDFRDILGNFDFSALRNVTFINSDAFISYVENVENNPFKKQYELLNKKLDIIQPYLPFSNAERASQFLKAISQAKSPEMSQQVKADFTQKLRSDFIELSRTLTSLEQWEQLLDACEEIRQHKEESALALN